MMRDVEVLEILKDELPKCFIRGDGKLPLAVGIHEAVLKHFESDKRFDIDTLKNAIHFYVKGTKYLSCVIVDAPRIDIHGNPVSKITQIEQDYAQKILENRKNKKVAEQNKQKILETES